MVPFTRDDGTRSGTQRRPQRQVLLNLKPRPYTAGQRHVGYTAQSRDGLYPAQQKQRSLVFQHGAGGRDRRRYDPNRVNGQSCPPQP
jgi:hypothetical protein